mgnify:CR=1 FL=1
MKTNECVLGIDTSNYTTSAAAVDSFGNIVSDRRKLLKVKQGERGLRQSDALFQHIANLPEIIEKLKSDTAGYIIKAVSVSSRPRPVEGSYMPVFNAGLSAGSMIASVLDVPLYRFSHQEGHIAAVRNYSRFKDKTKLLCCHLSGGTCEILSCTKDGIEIVGGSLDISFGQLLDRTGVTLGLDFPCGKALDEAALGTFDSADILTPIKVKDCLFNLSGIETQIMRAVADRDKNSDFSLLIKNIFDRITICLAEAVNQASELTGICSVLLCGGVSASRYVRREISRYIDRNISYEFGTAELSSDNAVGTALLGGAKLWQQNP